MPFLVLLLSVFPHASVDWRVDLTLSIPFVPDADAGVRRRRVVRIVTIVTAVSVLVGIAAAIARRDGNGRSSGRERVLRGAQGA